MESQRSYRPKGGRDRRGQIPNRGPLSEHPLHIDARKQIGHWECDTVIGASHWKRGSNENLNGLLRQYIPKKRAMSTVSDEEIRMIQNKLNSRPRKRLGFKTPAEVFHQSLKRVALRT